LREKKIKNPLDKKKQKKESCKKKMATEVANPTDVLKDRNVYINVLPSKPAPIIMPEKHSYNDSGYGYGWSWAIFFIVFIIIMLLLIVGCWNWNRTTTVVA